jgi:hypothetical protein
MPPTVSGAATVFGGEHVNVTYRQAFTLGDQVFTPGQSEAVLVRELEVDPSLIKFVELLLNELALADFICDRPAGWSRTLRQKSVLEIVAKAKALNFEVARMWAEVRADSITTLKALGLTREPAEPSTSSAPKPE